MVFHGSEKHLFELIDHQRQGVIFRVVDVFLTQIHANQRIVEEIIDSFG